MPPNKIRTRRRFAAETRGNVCKAEGKPHLAPEVSDPRHPLPLPAPVLTPASRRASARRNWENQKQFQGGTLTLTALPSHIAAAGSREALRTCGQVPALQPQQQRAADRSNREGSEFVRRAGWICRAFSYLMRFYKLFLRSYNSPSVSVEQILSFFLRSVFKDTFNPPVKILPDS